jgi:hypothetical protein
MFAVIVRLTGFTESVVVLVAPFTYIEVAVDGVSVVVVNGA